MDAWSAANAPHRILVYRTVGWTYVVGGSKDQQAWRILKLSRREVELTVVEDPTTYTREELTSLLRCLRDGNQAAGGLQFVCRAHGMAGCFRFLQGYYLLLILKKSMQGLIAGHKVYGVESTALLPLLHPEAHAAAFREGGTALPEARYRRIFGGVPLDSSFLFSRTWPLWRSVQSVLAPGAPAAAPPPNPDPFASQWVWNAHISLPLRALGLARWLTPLVHGFWTQRRLSVFGRPFTLTLLARRSRRFAGTRYRKRGLNADGFVANEVELEQVVEAGLDRRTRLPAISSWLQLRGSLPLFWYQAASSAVLKPEIVVQQYDPLYRATAAHFDALRARYGDPVVALDLVRRSGREAALGRAYEAALAQLNRGWAREGRPGVAYVAWDMQAAAKRAPRTLLARLRRVQAPALDATGFFVLGGATGGWGSCARAAPDGGEGGAGERDSGAAAAAAPPSSPSLRLQSGVLRTNCIDCLDRTNLAQFAAGLSALGRQLAALGLSGSARGLAPDSSAARALMDAYEAAGHAAAQQYGGSEAHASFFQRARGDGAAATTSRDLLTSLRRFYSNAYTDADKQDSINLLLGVFRPEPGQPHLWELDSDSALRPGGRQGSLEGSVRAGRFVPRRHGADAGSLERLPQEGHRGLSAGVAPVPPTLAPLRGLGGGATAAPAPAAERGGQPGSILQPPLPTAGEESDTSGDECFTPSLLHLLSSASAEDSFAPSASVDLALAAGLAPAPAALLTQELGAASHPPEQAAVLWGAEAVRHGLDSLGVSPGVAAWWAGDQLAVLVQQGLTLRAGLAQDAIHK
ncbi:Polyphosphoinositide phosphatase [Auxenochlorella protothecoides]|uniref:Polyphosphoinositide phosphatase n=1 Tax=Auxenochlorella protothecoides TaxID=3075 RepID=A0A087SQA5_AUXPR|nr:Polyphosphoinositide phosphatase [Auxenochlorella protothecoides]KFM27909.1 Polyphosphoinositide phosphatase [Auxenochlorella protothecoides]